MNDINQKLQVEVLAQQLKQNGIACSLDEASEKARSMIDCTEDKVEKPDEQLQILEQRYKFMLNSQKERFEQQLNNLRTNISDLTTELKDLKASISTNPVHKEEIQKKLKKPEEKIKPQHEVQQQTADGNGLNPADFAVDKIFYCGQK